MQMKKTASTNEGGNYVGRAGKEQLLISTKNASLLFFHPVPGKFIAQLKVSSLHHRSRS